MAKNINERKLTENMAKKSNESKKSAEIESIVPDTSVIIEGLLSRALELKEISTEKIIIHEAVLAELEHQANQNRASGMIGIEEIEKLKEISKKNNTSIEFGGRRPTFGEIKYAKSGEIDSLIRELAYEKGALLYTADKVQEKIAKAKGIDTMLAKIKSKRKLRLDSFFDDTTMSVHLRENVEPMAKKGMPGKWVSEKIKKTKITQDELKEISKEIFEESVARPDGFIEIERTGSTIIQLGKYRIVITRPPFSDGWEITAVRPVKHLSLSDYKLTEKLQKRIATEAEGILIAGAPGQGKSTFAQALAEFYSLQDKVVKTVEAPRDLVLPDSITQYAISHGTPEEIHDILLLVRPDNTIFDEMRNTKDFILFADLRLAGVGMVGVVHATNPVDAVQRFIGRIDLGVIPQVIDTVIFIKNGGVEKVLSLQIQVKVPAGMTEADLARPVVTVSDFETNRIEFEVYSYGEETVVVPVRAGDEKKPTHKLAKKQIETEFIPYTSDCVVEVVSDNKCRVYVPEHEIGQLIGKKGENISRIEKKLQMSVDVLPLDKSTKRNNGDGTNLEYDVVIDKKNIIFYVDSKYKEQNVKIMINDEFVMSAAVSKKGAIKIKKNNQLAKVISNAISRKEDIKLLV